MAKRRLTLNGPTKDVQWHNWLRTHGREVKAVEITELEDGGAHLAFTDCKGLVVLEDEWASFQVATEHFSPPRGWKGSRLTAHADKVFVSKQGEVVLDTRTK